MDEIALESDLKACHLDRHSPGLLTYGERIRLQNEAYRTVRAPFFQDHNLTVREPVPESRRSAESKIGEIHRRIENAL